MPAAARHCSASNDAPPPLTLLNLSRSTFVAPHLVLDAHQADRLAGASVVSIVAGPRDLARQVFVAWCAARRQPHVVPPQPTGSAAIHALDFLADRSQAGPAVLYVPQAPLAQVLDEAMAVASRHPRLPVAVAVPLPLVRQSLRELDPPLMASLRGRLVGGLIAADASSLRLLESDALARAETPLYRSDHEQVLHLLMRHDPTIGERFSVNHKLKVGRFSRYEIDFWCEPLKLAIEVDGLQHEHLAQRLRDAERDKVLGKMGVHSVRIRAGMVMRDPTAVIRFIRQIIERRSQEIAP